MKLPLLRAAVERYPALERLAGIADSEPSGLGVFRELVTALNDGRPRGARVGAGQLFAFFALSERVGMALQGLPEDLVEGIAESWEQEVGADSIANALSAFAMEYAASADASALGDSSTLDVTADVELGDRRPLTEEPTAKSDTRRRALELLLIVWWLNRNPALSPFRDLFDDRTLGSSPYDEVIRKLVHLLENALPERPENERQWLETLISPETEPDLVDQLARAVALDEGRRRGDSVNSTAPASALAEARRAARKQEPPGNAQSMPGKDSELHERLLRARDLVLEEMPRLPPGPPKAEPPRLVWDAGPATPRSLSNPPPPPPSKPWMKRLVLIAKHAKVWLHQLAQAAGTEGFRLDQVPDRELDELAVNGITGLWLIGVWERSRASRDIKRLLGADSATASAYSIFDYRVASDLGGDEAIEALQERALERGIRIGVDVVPNHMGIDSEWVRRHPERFLSLERPPYPSYDFDGPDLSGDPEIGLFLERHYYDQTDAAVVFRRLDRRTGDERFLYHGNDGTGMPWNDTAQLDYLDPAVRAAMMDVILGLARRFPILRFDAAMTLTRFHYQRLWFPAPGTGGAIPSRSEHGLSGREFERRMQTELWRDVCERAVREAPDTLLIAEAFWLMESYFVRELGMHRVYNSAFMHMLRDRDNGGYRKLLGDTAHIDRTALGRTVSFLSNPDERTARDQFGAGDRYFGVCSLLATLPGLPLLAHGQIGGLEEKYGMDFFRPRLDEIDDPALIERHRREIVPLFEVRERFAASEEFHLLRFVDRGGREVEDVFAFRNGYGRELALVVFNHSPHRVEGFVEKAVFPSNGREPGLGEPTPLPRSLRSGGPEPPGFLASAAAMEEHKDDLVGGGEAIDRTGPAALILSELRSGERFSQPVDRVLERGLELELEPFQFLVLVPFEESTASSE